MTELKPTPGPVMRDEEPSTGAGWRSILGWVIGIVGAVGIFAGGFVLVAGKDQYIGIGGDLSWRVGDIDPALAAGLLAVGALVALLGLALVVAGERTPRGVVRDRDLRDLQVHATAFVLVNAFLWIQDYVVGGGVEYAYWVTIPWGIGLAAHALAYYLGRTRHHPGAPQPR